LRTCPAIGTTNIIARSAAATDRTASVGGFAKQAFIIAARG
jgi:hypothetical protein